MWNYLGFQPSVAGHVEKKCRNERIGEREEDAASEENERKLGKQEGSGTKANSEGPNGLRL